MHNPGTYAAHVVDAGLMTNQAGNPVAAVVFAYTDAEGNPQQITWFGQVTGGAKDITVKTLVMLGFTGNDLSDLAQGKEVFNYDQQYEIVLENRTWEGKTKIQVKYINLPGGAGFRNMMSKEEAVQVTKGFPLAADFMQARQNMGKTAAKTAPKTQATAPAGDVPW